MLTILYLLFGGDSSKDSDVGKKTVKRPSIVQALYVGHCLGKGERAKERGEGRNGMEEALLSCLNEGQTLHLQSGKDQMFFQVLLVRFPW